ncbi:MAG TPA: HAMP domain-containing sensor histidine kinase [Ktedonobacteraceae bacterium]|nr:HAMP domain-containing sensor histidine kinase [Ktedonobacteraceae bacterium]
MESSVQSEQALLTELQQLRARVATLEQTEEQLKQALAERDRAHANKLALQEANQRMDEFLGIASHELRTPLTTMNGNIQLARRRLKSIQSPDTELMAKLNLVQDMLNRAERQVHVQNRLISDLLDVSRIQANRLELHLAHSDLLTIVRETIEDQRAAAPTRTLFLELPLQVPTIPIYADADRIIQVITNYITNALKYSESDRPVKVSVEIRDRQARVSVRDEGPGLTLQEQERIWQRFYRVPGINILSGSGVGLGLGLYICRTIIERHNGQVGVQSTVGKGSTFWFSLPLAENDSESPL